MDDFVLPSSKGLLRAIEGPKAVARRDGTLLAALFESLVALSARVYAARGDAAVRHLRTARGRQEIDLIVRRDDGAVVAVEIKLAQTVDDHDVRHRAWTCEKLGDRLLDGRGHDRSGRVSPSG